LARKHPERVLTSLHHLIDHEWMLEAYRLTRKDGAPGVDGMMAMDYEANLEANLWEEVYLRAYRNDFTLMRNTR